MDQENLEELLDCPVCLEKLDITNKVLPCQHTFCIRCLEKIISSFSGKLHCPECRTIYCGNIKDLPSNIFVNRLIELLKLRKNKTNSQQNDLSTDTEDYTVSLMNGKFSSIINRLCERIKTLPGTASSSYSVPEQRATTRNYQNEMTYRNCLNQKENINTLNSKNHLKRHILIASRRCQPDGTLNVGASTTGGNSTSENLQDSVLFLRSMYNDLERVQALHRRKFYTNQSQLLQITQNTQQNNSSSNNQSL